MLLFKTSLGIDKLNNSINTPPKNQLPNKVDILFNCLFNDSTIKGKENPKNDKSKYIIM